MSELLRVILDSTDIPEKELTVPEWGGVKLLLRGLTVAEMREVRAIGKDRDGKVDEELMAVQTVVVGVHDPQTKQKIFERAHRDALMKRGVSTIARIAKEILELSGETPDSLAAAEKNSQPGTPGSSTNSPGNSAVQ